MKYLFFFNFQLLLLCCVWCNVWCKFAIQDFVQKDRQKYMEQLQKYWHYYRRVHRRNSTHRYFTKSWKKTMLFCHNYRRAYRRFLPVGISPRVEKKLHFFATITDGYTNGNTDGLAIITDVYTDAFIDGLCTFQSACLSDVTDWFADGHDKTNARVFWRTISNGFQKIWRDFQNFWCENQLNTDGI
jgi:hypothetical protein